MDKEFETVSAIFRLGYGTVLLKVWYFFVFHFNITSFSVSGFPIMILILQSIKKNRPFIISVHLIKGKIHKYNSDCTCRNFFFLYSVNILPQKSFTS